MESPGINFSDLQLWPVLAGLGLFLYGMFMMEESLKGLAGRSFKLFLRKYTGNRISAVFSGALVTMVLQSSSLVTILVMSLAGAGIIGMASGIGMILGANLGTTATGWLVSQVGFKMDIETLILPLMAIGGLGIAFLKGVKLSNISKLLMGFSIMFLGLNYMKNSFVNVAAHVDMTVLTNKPYLLFVLFGFVFTALIQSSSASMTIYLASLAAGIITLPQAAFLIIGSDVGTSITGLLGTIKGNAIRKKVGMAQFAFNVVNGLIALLIFDLLFYIIKQVFHVTDPLFSLVLFHSLFNFAGILLILPFLDLFIKLLDRLTSGEVKKISRFIVSGNPGESISGIELLEKESVRYIGKVMLFNSSFFEVVDSGSDYLARYIHLKEYENEMAQFYFSLQQLQLTEKETRKLDNIIGAIRHATMSAKDLKDIKHNLEALTNNIASVPGQLLKEIQQDQNKFYQQLTLLFEKIEAVSEPDLALVNEFQHRSYNEETIRLYKAIGAFLDDIDLSSMQNMLRTISRSNDSIVKSVGGLLYKP